MAGCEKYMELISFFHDGELSASEERELLRHLGECPECRRIYNAFVSISENMPAEITPAPERFAEGTMYRIKKEATGASRRKKRFAFGGFTAIAACITVVIFAASRMGADFGVLGNPADSGEDGTVIQNAATFSGGCNAMIRSAEGGGTEIFLEEETEKSGETEQGGVNHDTENNNSYLEAAAETVSAEVFEFHVWTQKDNAAVLGIKEFLDKMLKYEVFAEADAEGKAIAITDQDTLLKLAELLSWNEIEEKVLLEEKPDFTAAIYVKDDESITMKIWIINEILRFGSEDNQTWAYTSRGSVGEFLSFIERT